MKLMALFLTLIVMFSSFTLKNLEAVPIYENPVIVKSNGLQGKKVSMSLNANQLRASLNQVDASGIQQGLRNDLIRQFSLGGLKKWVTQLSNQNLNSMSKTDEVANLNEIRTLSIAMQNNIHQTCGRISDLLKLLHLKLQEISTIDVKMNSLKPSSFRQNLSVVKKQTVQLKRALKKEKLAIKIVMGQIQKKQKTLIKAVSVYDKKFADKNKNRLKNLLTSINLQLKPQMSLPYFKKAFTIFVAHVLSIVKNLSPAKLSNYQQTAAELIKTHWKKILEKEKAEWEKSHKPKLKKVRLTNKKTNKKSPIKKIK